MPKGHTQQVFVYKNISFIFQYSNIFFYNIIWYEFPSYINPLAEFLHKSSNMVKRQ